MRIGSWVVTSLILIGLLMGATTIYGCGSDSGGKGPEEAAAEYVEAGNVRELEKFMDNAMFGLDFFEITDIETELVSETETAAVVELSCKIGLEGESVRGSKVEMTIDLENLNDEWIVEKVFL